ncbi:MAG: DUF6020 family protein [Eubacteriales bacterium]|nr:DUF6020 family protein [Eubacteriales bacterium]
MPFLILQAFLAAFALCNIGGISTGNILSLVLFGSFLLLFRSAEKYSPRRGLSTLPLPSRFQTVCRALAALYTLFYVAAEHKTLTGGFDSRLFRLAFVLATMAGLYALFLACCRLLLPALARLRPAAAASPLSRRQKCLVFFGLLACWLFWFLYNYPGVLTPDSISQFSQATGRIPFSSHHSVVHTLLFSLFYHAGLWLTGSVNAGIACYTIFQMLTLAAVETACISLMARAGARRWMTALAFCFWGLIPYNGIYAVTMWKDVLFSAAVLAYVLLLFLLLRGLSSSAKAPLSQSLPHLVGLLLSGWLVCTLRSNGLYVFIFTLPFVLIAFRRRWKHMLPLQLTILLLAWLAKGPVPDAFGVERPAFTESLSIPLQQVARVVTEGRALTAGQEELINGVVDVSLIPDYYNPSLSDPIKALVLYNNADAITQDPAAYASLWLRLGLSYPRDYLEAFIDQTKGYWFPSLADMRTNEGISPNEIGLAWPHLLRGQLPVKISEILLKLPDLLPLAGMLWSIGAFFWAVLFLFAFQLLYGEKKYLLLYLPFIGTVLTLLLATPVASDLRYAYPLFLSMPFLLSLPVLTRRSPEG